MKIDRSRVRKSTSEVPAECQQLIEKLQQCSKRELLEELSKINSWTFGKCELLHWAQVLDIFDEILGNAAEKNEDNKWALKCDSFCEEDKEVLICILRFTSLLIEHSFSRHLYNSMEHLLVLLTSNDMNVVLEVLNLLYMFSKRSNFITRLKTEEKECLLSRLQYLAENWGGKENGFGLADCCNPYKSIPSSATTLHVEFHREESKSPKTENSESNSKANRQNLHIIHIEHIDKLLFKTPAEIMKSLVSLYYVPPEKEMWLFTHVRLATHFAEYDKRLKCVQARLQALSVLVYSNAIQDSPSNLLYNGILEELVEVVELQERLLTDIKCAALRTLTAIIHLDRNPQFPNRRPGSRLTNIIDVTGASQYHGFLPVLVRNCIASLTSQRVNEEKGEKSKIEEISYTPLDESEVKTDVTNGPNVPKEESPQKDIEETETAFKAMTVADPAKFPVSLTTALFSFLYHLASYDVGGEALVSCGMMESLLQVINWQGYELDHITFVTRAVRVIDLITNIDMQAFQVHGGLQSFINRLDVEVNFCKKDQLYQVQYNHPEQSFDDILTSPPTSDEPSPVELHYIAPNAGKSCLPQRAALLKSMLNFLKKAFQDSAFSESIRHLMEGPLPSALKNIIANAEYYGPSLFLLATDVVTVYVYQEPALLSALQDNGLTSVVLHALLIKEVPATREVLGSLPNVFSALCLNARGLESFANYKPFNKLFQILLSPTYLTAMRRRRSSEPAADTACNLGNAMDELMRHQPSLRHDATLAIISLLEELVYLGSNPQFVCWRPHSRAEPSNTTPGRAPPTEGSSDEEEEDEDETSTSSQNANAQTQSENSSNSSHQSNTGNERQPIALVDYVLNAMKFIDAILSNNSTDDHCREFVTKGGLRPLLRLLGLPNLPADCPATNPAQAVATVCKSILNLAQEPYLFREGLTQLSSVLDRLRPLCAPMEESKTSMGGSRLLMELASTSDASAAFSSAKATPLLHAMGAAHGYVLMFVHVCRTGQTEIRSLSLQHWGSDEGARVLKGLADLYTALVWESTLLLAYCSDDLIPSECDFTRESIEKLNQFFDRCETTQNVTTETSSSTIDPLSATNPIMDVDAGETTKPDSRNLKYIKPLLGASSRLGRALAELFGLLVKLCVGSPVRQRRGQNIIAALPSPTPQARKVARALNTLLAKGLDCDSLPPCPTPKCRLTFLICSVGFTSPMLFDERRYPYYLMLKKFVNMGGQAIFFKTFRWALQGVDEGSGEISFPEGTLGFLDAWLTLLEKMVNPKAILESPHVISSRANASCNFDPLKYLIQIHRLAFDSIERLWKNIPVTSYGTRVTETILTILKHIYWGEKIIKEKFKQEESKSDQSSSSNGPAIRDNDDNLRQLVDMGFSREHAIEALLHSNTLEQATDYLLSNPPLARPSTSNMDADGEDDQVLQAIAISLGCTSNNLDNPHATMEELENLLNDFTANALKMCLELLNKMPELVHKTCELLVTIMKRNGKFYRDNLLDSLVQNIITNANYMETCMIQKDAGNSQLDSDSSKRLANYTHLFILFYEVSYYYEMKIPFMAIYGTPLLEVVVTLIKHAERLIHELYKESLSIQAPKWLAPCLLLIDAYSKVSNRTDRKNKMHISTNRVWRWYDLVTGRWTHYSLANNRIINEAYWNGDQSVRVTCGRKRYTVTFPNMLQMNDETGNNRPIAMSLLTSMHPSGASINEEPPEGPLYVELTAKERARCIPVPPLSKNQLKNVLEACVSLLHLPLDRDLLHSVLQVCVRFTRDFEMAKVFVQAGGIKCLLNLRHINDFSGFAVLATILIRHALEEPNTLTCAMEKVIRGRALSTIPPPYRDLVYLSRQLGAAVTRDPEIFFQVANNILRIDIQSYKPGEPLDAAFPLRVEPPTRSKAPPLEDSVSIQVVYDLLEALLKPLVEKKDENIGENKKPENEDGSSKENSTNDVAKPGPSKAKDTGSTSNNDKKKENNKGTSTTNDKKDENLNQKPMLPKSVILKILADAVVSYGPIAKLVTEYTFKANCHPAIKEDTSALAFIFDKILPETEGISDSECFTMCRMLIAALSSANHSPDAQLTLVSEVKSALSRALALPESSEKHSQIQHICGIISTMIDNCPMPPNGRMVNLIPINNIIKMMIRRGLFNDLAKITHYLDLSSPHTSFTANAALKPLESLSRTINQPGPNTTTAKGRKPSATGSEDATASSNVTAEPTRLEEEDAENVEDAQSETAADRNINEGEGDRLEEIMEQILEGGTERDRNASMELDDDGPLGYDPERDATEDLMSTDSGESDSDRSDQAEDEGNNDEDGDEDNIDDNDDNDDNNYEDDENNDGERRGREETSGFYRVATNDRDEDVLMIHYEGENEIPRIRWTENGYAIPMLDDNSGDQVIIHPLLLSRHGNDTAQTTVSRTQRANRARRYQYLFNPRNPNPPVILQRLLGTHDPHTMASMMTASNILTGPADMTREQARVVIMDNLGLIPPNEEQIDFVDQSGYLFGPSLAATLSHVPPVVHWWNMESKLLDLESIFDCASWICNRLLPKLLKHRNEELKMKKAKEEEIRKRKSRTNPESTDTPSEGKTGQWREDLKDTDDDNQVMLFNYVEDSEAEQNSRDRTEGSDNPERSLSGEQNQTSDVQNLFNYRSDSSSGESTSNRERGENRGDISEDLRAAVADVLVERTNPEGIDGIPLEASSEIDSNDGNQVGNNVQNEIVLSPLQLNFLRSDNSNSQSLPEETTQNAAVQTNSGENPERSEESNSRPDSEASGNLADSEDQEGPDTRVYGDSGAVSLQAIFEEAINQHIEDFASGVERVQAEGASSNSSSEQPSQVEDRASNVPPSETAPSGDLTEGSGDTARTAGAGPSNAPDDEEIPEGVDPSFLEALPPEIRREVLEQHRILCLQQRLAARVRTETVSNGESSNANEGPQEVSPEFLAALPPALQEEVLTQQRLEQQRQAAAGAPPNEPVDAQAFFQTLQPSLRTMILSDMEDSQMSALPPELAAEAQNLRRDWYARNRQMAQERFLPAIIRHARGGRQPRPLTFQRGGWNNWGRSFISAPVRSVHTQMRIRGRQLLDHDGISCLLILLFTDDPHLNKLRLHRVIRNLCYHAPTREWIINALLAIIDKSVHTQQDDIYNKPTRKVPRAGPLTSKLQTDVRHLNAGGHWLTIRMEAALGCAANVFSVNKGSGKKAERLSGNHAIGIHPQAIPVVCRNTLDLFTALAKAFPSCLLPTKLFREEALERSIPPVRLNAPGQPDFWDVLLKLDSAGAKKGKSIAKAPTAPAASDNDLLSFDDTVFGRLLNMLESPIVYRNTQLTDNLLKLLSVTTSGMPELAKSHRLRKPTGNNQNSELTNDPPINALSLAVNVITYKSCSEEGLEFTTNLLLNLASASSDMSLLVLNLLLNGAVEMGVVLEEQIHDMLTDVEEYNYLRQKKQDENAPSTSKGVIHNRFTNEQVVITASSKIKTACELQLPSMVPLTSKSSGQIFFLRVLRVIVQIRNSIKNNMKRTNADYELLALSEQLNTLRNLWKTLSRCLSALEDAPDHHAVLVLQPTVEAFFLVHSPQQGAFSYKGTEEEEEEERPAAENNTNRPAEGTSEEPRVTFDFEHRQAELANRVVTPEQQKFLSFAETHRTVLNQILRQSTAHLADGPFAVLVDHTRILDFDIKRRYFRTELERMDHGIRREETAVHVRRSNVFEDSFRELFRRNPEEWKNRFYIVFEDEEGQDAGGLLREWYVIISRDIFNPMYALFTVSPGDRVTYMINSASHYNSNHLCYYKFVGRVIAKAIYDNKLLECYFTRSFYKHILGIPVKYTDMESEDYSFYRGLVYLMENNINNLGLDLTFSTEISEFGVTETRDLIPNGRHIPVSEENKMEYVRLVCQMKMTGAIKQQLTAFLEGFYDIIPMRLISIFNEQELELLISGLPNIDIDDLKTNTEYHKYQSNSLQIQWFWRALRSFDQADRAKFLQFVTGTSKVPLQGFGALEGMNGVQKFQIHRDDRSTDRLPSAHTCFNQLDLPVYETYDKLRAYLLKAIHECSEGFGFA